MPSALKSPTARPVGVPTAGGEPIAGVNAPKPSPSSTVTVLPFKRATARSFLPSPLKSAATTLSTTRPLGRVTAKLKAPLALPR